jgi:hypothetical protein
MSTLINSFIVLPTVCVVCRLLLLDVWRARPRSRLADRDGRNRIGTRFVKGLSEQMLNLCYFHHSTPSGLAFPAFKGTLAWDVWALHFFHQKYCAGSSGAVHSVFLMNVYLDLENPGGSGFWVGENRRVTGGTERVSLQAPGSRGGRILTPKEGSK